LFHLEAIVKEKVFKKIGKGAIEYSLKEPAIGVKFTVIVLKTLGRIGNIFIRPFLYFKGRRKSMHRPEAA